MSTQIANEQNDKLTIYKVGESILSDKEIHKKIFVNLPAISKHLADDVSDLGLYNYGMEYEPDYQLKINKDQRIMYKDETYTEEIMYKLKSSRKIYQDQQFPANKFSLVGKQQSEQNSDQDWKDPENKYKWKPILELQDYKDGDIFCNQKIYPNHIVQGYLQDCYLLAALCALAQKPQRIQKLFMVTQKNDVKYFSVKILLRGIWQRIDLDQMIPFMEDQQGSQIPAFSRPVDHSLWVLFLEKAWAKLYGSYKKIQLGFAHEALHDLTGAPIEQIKIQKEENAKEQIWQKLKEAIDKQYAIVCYSNQGEQQRSQNGIQQGHVFTLLGIYELSVQNQIQRLIRIRDPHAEQIQEYKCKWSDSYQGWKKVSALQKERIKYKNDENDGIFFICLEDFINQFRFIQIAQIIDSAFYNYESIVDKNSRGAYFTVRIIDQGSYSFQINKTPERKFSKSINKYPKASIHIKRIPKNSQKQEQQFEEYEQIFEEKKKRNRILYRSYNLKPGKYVVYVKINFNVKFEKDYLANLAVYSQKQCALYISTSRDAQLFHDGEISSVWLGQYYRYVFQPALKKYLQPEKCKVFNNNAFDNFREICEKPLCQQTTACYQNGPIQHIKDRMTQDKKSKVRIRQKQDKIIQSDNKDYVKIHCETVQKQRLKWQNPLSQKKQDQNLQFCERLLYQQTTACYQNEPIQQIKDRMIQKKRNKVKIKQKLVQQKQYKIIQSDNKEYVKIHRETVQSRKIKWQNPFSQKKQDQNLLYKESKKTVVTDSKYINGECISNKKVGPTYENQTNIMPIILDTIYSYLNLKEAQILENQDQDFLIDLSIKNQLLNEQTLIKRITSQQTDFSSHIQLQNKISNTSLKSEEKFPDSELMKKQLMRSRKIRPKRKRFIPRVDLDEESDSD